MRKEDEERRMKMNIEILKMEVTSRKTI